MNRCEKFLSHESSRTRLPLEDREERDDVRWDVIRRVRAAIARGDYESDERWKVTVDRLLEALGR